MWANYRTLGLPENDLHQHGERLRERAQRADRGDGRQPQITAVLLTCSDATARQRIARREIGSELDRHIERSDLMARRLDRRAPAWVHRVATDGRAVTDIAAEVIALTGWIDEQPDG
jgi:hypothetical protein